MRCLLALLPAVAYAGAVVATYPTKAQVTAPFRLALVRAAVLVGAFAVLGVEALSRYRHIDLTGFVWLWGIGAVVALGAAAARWRGFTRPELPKLDRSTLLVGVGLGAVYLGALVLAVAYPPNNFDSMTYHLPRIEHWVQQHTVEVFAVRIHRQVTYPPGAEYLMLHLRVLTGGDRCTTSSSGGPPWGARSRPAGSRPSSAARGSPSSWRPSWSAARRSWRWRRAARRTTWSRRCGSPPSSRSPSTGA
ncbi:hypothetical protein R8Z50_00030 [Longispora sp. K20-0274]|uniref:hypothetical protein n=1 Tax=Longispora sp. K20-0274 TaxID=3088255 RepID=UPI003999B659